MAYTNMLTWAELEGLSADGGPLVKWPPRAATAVDGRCLYMLRDVFERFENSPWPDAGDENPVHTRQRRSAMRSVLERYARGHALVLRSDIKEMGSQSRLAHMRGYWEFRSQGRMTETRLFGFFARPGAFVATDFQSRANYQNQADWDAQRASCGQRWRDLTNGQWHDEPWPVEVRGHLKAYLDHEDD